MKRSRSRASGNWIIVALALAAAGCATTGNYEKKLKTWMGNDVNSLIASWGPPSDEYLMPNGSKMYTWLHRLDLKL